jgi:hypothetical protein
LAGTPPQGDVKDAGCVIEEGSIADGHVSIPLGVVVQRINTSSDAPEAGCVVKKSAHSHSCVGVTGGVRE